MNNASIEWRSIGIALVVLLAFGMISDKTERIAIWVAVLLALAIVLRKWKG